MRKILSPAALFLLSVICMLIGCGDNKQQDTIKVGLIVELTGDMPGVGASSKNAAQLAVNEQNSAGGISIGGKPYQIELVVEDNASKAEQSVAAVNKLITQDNVLAIVKLLNTIRHF
jgi:branched-chain amino acid transport system substrate-binding protein